jgi:hypothetical protein
VDGAAHPITLSVSGGLERSRLLVFFRLLVALAHIIWLAVWGIAAYVFAIVGWFAALITGRLPDPLHRFLSAYLRFAVHVSAFVFLAADRFPDFNGREGTYPIDVHIEPPARQNRWKTGFRLILAIPAGILGSALTSGSFTGGTRSWSYSISLLTAIAVLAWFVGVFRARITPGFRDAITLALAYGAQELGYVLLLTDRYPTADPQQLVRAAPAPPRWTQVQAEDDDGRRNRWTVFFRLFLALPAIVWLFLWGLLMLVVVLLNWFALLITGRSPSPFHRFSKAFVRYGLHVYAYLDLLTQPYPWFRTAADYRYAVDVTYGDPAEQNRWKTLFRAFLAFPAWLVAAGYSSVLSAVAFLGWFAALFTGRMPIGLRKLGLVCINYLMQTYAYALLLTDEYPYSGPVVPAPPQAGLNVSPT